MIKKCPICGSKVVSNEKGEMRCYRCGWTNSKFKKAKFIYYA